MKDKAMTQDLGRHLELGKTILTCHCVPRTNLFSFTLPNQPFINHHWLSEVVFFLFQSLGGISSIIFFKVVVILLTFFIMIFTVRKKASIFWICVLSVPYILLFSERFDARPEIFSFLFLSIFILAIERYRQTKSFTLFYLLPFIQILWTNMHIYFLVGIGLVGFLIIEQLVLYGKKLDKRLLILAGGLLLLTLVNPNGLSGALYPLEVLHGYGYSIEENQNIFFLNSFFFNVHILIFEIIAPLLLISMAFIYRKKDLFWILSCLFAVVAAGWMIRNFPLFVIITFPAITYLFTTFEKRFLVSVKPASKKVINSCIFLGISCIVLITVINHIESPLFGFGFIDPGKVATDFFIKNNIKGPIFNNFDIGSYLIYRLYPQTKVFVDGRPEAYTVAFFDQYKKMQEDPTFFASQSAHYHLNAIIFSQTDATPWAQEFLRNIAVNKQWVPVYADGYIVILLKNNQENKQIIEKYTLR
jgi:hypothetical protein